MKMSKYYLFSIILMILLLLPIGTYAVDTGTYNEGITAGIERGRTFSFRFIYNEVIIASIIRASNTLVSEDIGTPPPSSGISVPESATFNEGVSVEVERPLFKDSMVIYLIIIIITMIIVVLLRKR